MIEEAKTLINVTLLSISVYCITGAIWHSWEVLNDLYDRLARKGFYRQ